MRLEYQILTALGLDLLFGDPRWLPHPVRFIGNLALKAEQPCRRLFGKPRTAGIMAVLFVLVASALAGGGLLLGAAHLYPPAGDMAAILLLYFCFAAKDLAAHATAVRTALEANNIPRARQKVSMIVGRDTECLDGEGIARAGIESVAENIVDGSTAPLFYATLFGPLGALLYKTINTLDSTFGYKNERYRHFGWAAARLDDLANFLPARISGFLVVLAALFCGLNSKEAWRIFRRDRRQHASPNAGHTEAAMAGALGLQLGGKNYYFGQPVTKPTIGEATVTPAPLHLALANRMLFVTIALAAFLFLAARFGLANG